MSMGVIFIPVFPIERYFNSSPHFQADEQIQVQMNGSPAIHMNEYMEMDLHCQLDGFKESYRCLWGIFFLIVS